MYSRMIVALFVLANSVALSAQVLTTPQASPAATVMQEVGISTVTITYHSPAVRERTVWGGLVPYGLSPGVPWGSKNDFPWRAGANENTTISFSHDVKIEGKSLPAGTYGLSMIPGEKDWTIVFSKNSTSWGSFYYDPKEDALRVSVKPVATADFRENLAYGFDQISNTTGTAFLHWEKLKVPFRVEFDTPSIQMATLRNEMRGGAGFNLNNIAQAAAMCLQSNAMLEDAMGWVDRGLLFGGGVNLRFAKADLLNAMGKKDEAAVIKKAAIDAATENDLNTYGYTLMGTSKFSEAIAIFQLNLKNHPQSWNCYDSLADAFDKSGNKKDAIANYKKALQMAPDNQKKRIQGILDTLGK